jgi:hypothetical protein
VVEGRQLHALRRLHGHHEGLTATARPPRQTRSAGMLPHGTLPRHATGRLRGKSIFWNGFNVICPVQSSHQKYSASLPPQITITTRAIPSRERGVGHRHERWGGMRWTQGRRRDACSQGGFRERATTRRMSGADAYGKTVWSRHPWLVPSCRWRHRSNRIGAPSSRQRRRQEEFVSGEQLCFRRPVYGRPQGWRCAPPPPAADGLDPVRPPVFRLGMRSAGAERDRSLCDG